MKALVTIFALALGMTACTKGADTTVATPTPVPGEVVAATPTPVPSLACNIETAVAKGIAVGMGQLGCTGADAIQADVLAASGKANFCVKVQTAQDTVKRVKSEAKDAKSVTEKGIVGAIGCPLIVNGLDSLIINNAKSSWACGDSLTVDAIKTKITALCVAAIPL